MAGKGGYQAPANPAPASGPGAMSQRTDGGPADTQAARYVSGLPFGEGQAFMATQKSADMSGSGMMPEPAPIVPLNAPSQRPNEPVTAGADAGAGPDMSSLGLGAKDVAATAESRAIMASYVPALLNIASQPGTSPETRNIIRQLREMI